MCSALRKRQCSSKSARSGKLENQVQMWSPSARFGRSLMRDLRATNRLPMPPERLFKPRSINGVPKPLRNKVASESHYETEVAYKSHNVTSVTREFIHSCMGIPGFVACASVSRVPVSGASACTETSAAGSFRPLGLSSCVLVA